MAAGSTRVIQRVIEILRSIPTIPLWMGLAAALPADLERHPGLFRHHRDHLADRLDRACPRGARPLPGLREEDFITAAELAGACQMRIIFRHMVPSFLSHIIAAVSLALPAMIISETTLSFLGLGLRPPAISWGVLLQDAQNLQALASAPWLLVTAVPGHHRHPRLQLPGRRAPRRGRPLWLSRSSSVPQPQDLLPPGRGRRPGGRRRQLRPAARPHAGHRRRIRLRQERHRPLDPAHRRAARAGSRAARSGSTPLADGRRAGRPRQARRARAGDARHPRRRDRPRLPGADDLVQRLSTPSATR